MVTYPHIRTYFSPENIPFISSCIQRLFTKDLVWVILEHILYTVPPVRKANYSFITDINIL